MKTKTSVMLTLTIGLFLMSFMIKVDVCHNVDNNPHTINIAWPAAVAHLIQHSGDSLGDCNKDDDDNDGVTR